IDAIGEHVTMIAIAGDNAVLARLQRRLDAHRNRFLADIEVTETADEPQAVKLSRLLLEPADQHHLAIEFQQFFLTRLIINRLLRTVPFMIAPGWGFGFLRAGGGSMRRGWSRQGLYPFAWVYERNANIAAESGGLQRRNPCFEPADQFSGTTTS